MKPTLYLPLTALTLALVGVAGCSSSNNDKKETPQVTPVTGEFHNIQPNEVDAYVAQYEAQRREVMVTIDSQDHELEMIGDNAEEKTLVVGYEDEGKTYALLIGFDLDKGEPRPLLQFQQVENDAPVIAFTGVDDSIQITEAGDNLVYTGTLTQSFPAASDDTKQVRLVFNESLVTGGTTEITVEGTDAILTGDLGTGSYIAVRDMIANNPSVTRLILQESTGSVNDDINVHTGRLIRNANLATHVPADGDINSGAVDLFAAGTTRTVEAGAKLGVHSWCCTEDGKTANQLSVDNAAHGVQLTYFREMLGEPKGVDFYFFTINAAPFNGIHVMTQDELTKHLQTP